MPRTPASQSLEQIIQAVAAKVVANAAASIAKAVADIAAQELDKSLSLKAAKVKRPVRGVHRSRPRIEVTKWVADKRARRVPNFVIESTGLKTKKAIVAKFGEASFEKGKPLPKLVKAG